MNIKQERENALNRAYLDLGERVTNGQKAVIEKIREAAVREGNETFNKWIAELVMNAIDTTLFSEHPHILAQLAFVTSAQ